MASSVKPIKLWVVYGEEETPLGIAWAKTAGGAKKRYERSTGRSREGIHVVSLSLSKDYHSFVSPI